VVAWGPVVRPDIDQRLNRAEKREIASSVDRGNRSWIVAIFALRVTVAVSAGEARFSRARHPSDAAQIAYPDDTFIWPMDGGTDAPLANFQHHRVHATRG
jgi:hypothetical protein